MKRFLSYEFLKFLIIGVINTFSTTVIASFLDRFEIFTGALKTFNVTFVIGYISGLVISFFLNTYFTFSEKPTLKKAIKFPLSYIPNFLIQYILVWIFKSLSLDLTLAYLLAAVLGVPITFIIMRKIIKRSC